MTSNTNPEHRTQVGTGHFIVTLCRLAAPASIRPPQAPLLRAFTFFTSLECEPDGSEALYLHMGYFDTLSDAERWAEALHGHFPGAIATVAPAALLPLPKSEEPCVRTADSLPAVPPSTDIAPVEDNSLTDTRVLKILEMRGIAAARNDVDASNCHQIALLRPEDTSTRLALKQAVAQGAPVSFAVQLHWSAQPIDLMRVPSLAIFRGYTVYATESRRDGHSRYFLRLGFFSDPVSARQLAAQLRSNFASAAVVPVADEEVMRAREATANSSSIPYLVQQRVAPARDFDRTSAAESKSVNEVARRDSQTIDTLEQTLERMAQRERWTDPDSLSESGVRHLRISSFAPFFLGGETPLPHPA
jgi:hypothetical protein